MPTTTTKAHTGRVVLVTGAASGIGHAVAVGLAERGATVIVAGHGDLIATTEPTAQVGDAASAEALDISDPASIESRTRATRARARTPSTSGSRGRPPSVVFPTSGRAVAAELEAVAEEVQRRYG
jgi:NAD(P)-dependent dehydrogenase (short-subunit alcohol dehydrogenase family)